MHAHSLVVAKLPAKRLVADGDLRAGVDDRANALAVHRGVGEDHPAEPGVDRQLRELALALLYALRIEGAVGVRELADVMLDHPRVHAGLEHAHADALACFGLRQRHVERHRPVGGGGALRQEVAAGSSRQAR